MKARIPKGMGGGPQNMNAMIKQAQKMQEDMENLQAELDEREYDVSAGGGVVTVVGGAVVEGAPEGAVGISISAVNCLTAKPTVTTRPSATISTRIPASRSAAFFCLSPLAIIPLLPFFRYCSI